MQTEPQDQAPALHRPPWPRGYLAAVLPAGFLLGVVGGFLQAQVVHLGVVPVGWGALLMVAVLVVLIRALSLNMETRLAGALCYGGWLIATVLMALPNPSGDVVFTSTPWSLGYLLGGAVLGAAAAAWPLFLAGPTPADSTPPAAAGELP